MGFIAPTDPDFRVMSIDRSVLEHLQRAAEEAGLATRWSSAEALRSQVAEGPILMQSLMREQRSGRVRTYRCVAVFRLSGSHSTGGVTTIDIEPDIYGELPSVDLSPDGLKLVVRMFALALDSIVSIEKS